MKIIAGAWKGLVLTPPPPTLSRPTQERVKKSIFDILGDRIRDSRVLDLFAGSGTLGIEALSRGAKEVMFVEWHPLCMKRLKENLSKLGEKKEILCVKENAFRVLRRVAREGRRFDVVFMDPPYKEEVTTKCLRIIGECDILTPNAILVVRHAQKEHPPLEVGLLRCWRQKPYGETQVSFYRLSQEG